MVLLENASQRKHVAVVVRSQRLLEAAVWLPGTYEGARW